MRCLALVLALTFAISPIEAKQKAPKHPGTVKHKAPKAPKRRAPKHRGNN